MQRKWLTADQYCIFTWAVNCSTSTPDLIVWLDLFVCQFVYFYYDYRKLKPSLLQPLLRNLTLDVPRLSEDTKMPLKVFAIIPPKPLLIYLKVHISFDLFCDIVVYSCLLIIMSRTGSTTALVVGVVLLAPPRRRSFDSAGSCFGKFSEHWPKRLVLGTGLKPWQECYTPCTRYTYIQNNLFLKYAALLHLVSMF